MSKQEGVIYVAKFNVNSIIFSQGFSLVPDGHERYLWLYFKGSDKEYKKLERFGPKEVTDEGVFLCWQRMWGRRLKGLEIQDWVDKKEAWIKEMIAS